MSSAPLRFFGGPLNKQTRYLGPHASTFLLDPEDISTDDLEGMCVTSEGGRKVKLKAGFVATANAFAERKPILYERHVIQCVGITKTMVEDVMVAPDTKPGDIIHVINEEFIACGLGRLFPEPIKVPVESSFISWIAYDPKVRSLDVYMSRDLSYGDPAIYRYWNVDTEDVLRMLAASSVGSYFNEHVRDNTNYYGFKLPFSYWQLHNS